MLRKIIGTALLAVTVVSLGCGGGSKSSESSTMPEPSATNDTTPSTTETTPSTTETTPSTTATSEASASTTSDTMAATTTDPSDKSPVAGGAADATMQAAAPMDDATIFAMLTAANEHEIAAAKLAASKSKNKDVKAFAKMMQTEHQKMLDEGNKLAKKLKVTPNADAADVKSLRDQSQAALTKLQGLDGAEFDKAYADLAVQDHQMVLGAITDKLMPAASDAQVKKLLEGAKPKVAMHLEHAQKLQGQVGGSK